METGNQQRTSRPEHDVKWQMVKRFEDGDVGVELSMLALNRPIFNVQIVQKTKDGLNWRARVTLKFLAENGQINSTDATEVVDRILQLMSAAAHHASHLAQDAEDSFWNKKREREAKYDNRARDAGGSADEQRRRIKQQNGWDARGKKRDRTDK